MLIYHTLSKTAKLLAALAEYKQKADSLREEISGLVSSEE